MYHVRGCIICLGSPQSDTKSDWGNKLLGIPALRPREYAQVLKPTKTVQRAYGGSRCSNCVKDLVVRAFLIEGQNIVKKVLKETAAKKKGVRGIR